MSPSVPTPFAVPLAIFYRWLALAAAIALLGNHAMWTYYMDEAKWVAETRLLCVAFLLALVAATYLSKWVRAHSDLAAFGVLILLMGHMSITLYASHLAQVYAFAAIVLTGIGTLTLFQVWQVLTLNLLTWITYTAAAFLTPVAEMSTQIFSMMLAIYCICISSLAVMMLILRDRQHQQQLIHGAIYQNSLDGLIYGETKSGTVASANPSALQIMETDDPQEAGDLLNLQFKEYFGSSAEIYIRKALEGKGWRGTYPVLTAKGREIWVDCIFNNLSLPGNKMMMMVQFSDATERMSDSLRLKEMKILLDRSQSMARVGGWQYEPATHRWSLTPSALHILRMPQEMERPYRHLLAGSASERHEVLMAFRSIIVNGNPFDLEVSARTYTGRRLRLRLLGEALIQNGKVTRVVGVFSDITEREEREQALRRAKESAEDAAKARSQFLANMSHEIRTPMNGVIGMASLLIESDLTEEHKRLVSTINSSGEALLRIINEILDFSKIDAGELELDPRPFSLDTLLEDTAALFRPLATKRDLQFNFKVQGVADAPMLQGDETRIRQIITNLLSNAIKFTEKGRVELRARLRPEDGKDYSLELVVQDSGIGIEPKRIETLFEPFAQADPSITRRYGGTGLGLSICRQLATLMNGTLIAESVLGQGSTFRLNLPLTAAEQAVTQIVEAPRLKQYSQRVLLVEDNAVNQAVALRMLKKLGIDADLAENGRVAIERVKDTRYDLVFMDMQMPEIDGLEATRLIRIMDDLHQPQIVAMTANALEEDRQQCLEAGMNDFVSKPVRLEDMRRILGG